MAGYNGAVAAERTSAALRGRLIAWRGRSSDHGESPPAAPRPPLLSLERADLIAYGAIALLFLATAVPFVLARAEGATAGLGGLPAASVWEPVGRALAIDREGLRPVPFGAGPTSPLWTWILAVPYKLVGWTGLPIGALAKAFGFLAAALAAAGLYNLALLSTGRRWPGALAVGLIALDPALAFDRVSGGETTVMIALAAFSMLALVQKRLMLLSWLLAAHALARPDGAVLALLVILTLAVGRLWNGGRLSDSAESDLRELGLVALPTAAALGAWGLYGIATAASPLPFARGAASLGAVRALWSGFLGEQPAFASGFALVLAAALLGAGFLYWRRWGVAGAALALMPLAVAMAALWAPTPSVGRWGYDGWRQVEPMLPWCALALAVALATAGEVIWERQAARGTAAPLGLPMGRLLAVVPLLLWLLNGLPPWLRAPSDYAWGAHTIAELPLAAADWLAENAPEEARIGLLPGAEPVRGNAERQTLALPPLNREHLEDLRELDLEYIIAEPGSVASGWARARETMRFELPAAEGRAARMLSVFQLDWRAPQIDRSQPILLRFDGYQVLDALDVGNGTSETRHFYAATTPGTRVSGEARLLVGWLADDGRAQEIGRGAESFVLAARPGQDMVLGVRYDGASRGVLRLEVDRESFEWRLRDCGSTLCEDAFVVPGGFVKSAAPRVSVTFGGAAGGRIATYHYWAFVRG
jgi:hypothetical protein